MRVDHTESSPPAAPARPDTIRHHQLPGIEIGETKVGATPHHTTNALCSACLLVVASLYAVPYPVPVQPRGWRCWSPGVF